MNTKKNQSAKNKKFDNDKNIYKCEVQAVIFNKKKYNPQQALQKVKKLGLQAIKNPAVHTTKSLQRVRIRAPIGYDKYYLKSEEPRMKNNKDIRFVMGCKKKK